ncbi:peptide ABC transporter substrate-binding protein [Actinomycetota bacterium]|nr:peptide ABC transporter substrate-binding protein [Actinomycetota bacterium]
MKKLTKLASVLSVVALSVAGLTSCGSSDNASKAGTPADTLVVGTLDKVMTIDPAGSYDHGSKDIQDEIFLKLYDYAYNSTVAEPSLATSGDFSADGKLFVVKIRKGIKFANGNDLTSSDVKYTFDRILNIKDPNGPDSMLEGIDSIATPDDETVEFTLKNPNDVTIKQVLAANAGPIVDEDVFPFDRSLTDDEVVASKGYFGQYNIVSYTKNESAVLEANPDYQGLLPAPAMKKVNLKYYTTDSNLKIDLTSGKIDAAFNGLGATDVADLESNDNVTVTQAEGGRYDFIAFNFHTQPYGLSQPDADPQLALAVRTAVANLIDRKAIAKDVFKDTYEPAYSIVGGGLEGKVDTFKSLSEADPAIDPSNNLGDGKGGPSLEKAKAVLETFEIPTPVALNIQYNPDHYTAASTEEYNAIKSQLEESGLFKVTLGTTEWTTYQKDRVNTESGDGKYPVYQLGWFNDFPDADNFLTPFFGGSEFIHGGYGEAGTHVGMDTGWQELLASEPGITDDAKRLEVIKKIQVLITPDVPIIPIVQGKIIAFTAKGVTGVEQVVNAAQSYRFGALSKAAL